MTDESGALQKDCSTLTLQAAKCPSQNDHEADPEDPQWVRGDEILLEDETFDFSPIQNTPLDKSDLGVLAEASEIGINLNNSEPGSSSNRILDYISDASDPTVGLHICNQPNLRLSEPRNLAIETENLPNIPDVEMVQDSTFLQQEISEKSSLPQETSLADDVILVEKELTPLSAENAAVLSNIKIEGEGRSPLKCITNDSIPKTVTSGLKSPSLAWRRAFAKK